MDQLEKSTHPKKRPLMRGGRAFTLIELLVVIAVIGILASLVLGVLGYASRTSKEKRVQAELAQLETAIENYRSELGFYPPDNVVNPNSNPVQVNATINPLFYELVGTVLNPDTGRFSPTCCDTALTSGTIGSYFNVDGFANSSTDPGEVENFISWMKPSHVAVINEEPQVEVLASPVPWPESGPNAPVPGTDVNPWRYVSSSPTNNPGSFDLWAEVPMGDETKVIGNWKQ